MKFLIVFACIVAGAFAADYVNVLRNDAEVNIDSYKYALELDNHVVAAQDGVLRDPDTLVVHGNYGWISPEGEQVQVSYVADENGYQPSGNVLPTPHPIPQAIINAIRYIETHPSKENYH